MIITCGIDMDIADGDGERYESVIILGKRKLKLPFLGRLILKMFLKVLVKDDSPLRRYLPAVDELKVNEPIESNATSKKRNGLL